MHSGIFILFYLFSIIISDPLQDRINEQRAFDQKSLEQKTHDSKLIDQRLNDQRVNEQRLNEQRLNEQRLNEQRLNEQRLNEQRLNEQRLNEHRFNEQRLNDQRIVEQRINEQRQNEQRIREQTLNDVKLIELRLIEARLEEARLNEALYEKSKLIGSFWDDDEDDETIIKNNIHKRNRRDTQTNEDAQNELTKSDSIGKAIKRKVDKSDIKFEDSLDENNLVSDAVNRFLCTSLSWCLNISSFYISKGNKFQCNEEYVQIHIKIEYPDPNDSSNSKMKKFHGTMYLTQIGRFEAAQKISSKCVKIRE